MNRRFRLGLLFIAVLPVLKLQAQEQKAQPDINLRTVEHLSSFAQTTARQRQPSFGVTMRSPN